MSVWTTRSLTAYLATPSGAISMIIALALTVLLIVAWWKMFKKMGEPGWKCLIPFYNEYILYKRTWSPTIFWVQLGLVVVSVILLSLSINPNATSRANLVSNDLFVLISSVLILVASVLQLIGLYFISKSFGHGIGYFIGLLLLTSVFFLIIAFGSSRYIGPKGNSINLPRGQGY